jgi:hypothetical protein
MDRRWAPLPYHYYIAGVANLQLGKEFSRVVPAIDVDVPLLQIDGIVTNSAVFAISDKDAGSFKSALNV